jgi:hypothetical protein
MKHSSGDSTVAQVGIMTHLARPSAVRQALVFQADIKRVICSSAIIIATDSFRDDAGPETTQSGPRYPGLRIPPLFQDHSNVLFPNLEPCSKGVDTE